MNTGVPPRLRLAAASAIVVLMVAACGEDLIVDPTMDRESVVVTLSIDGPETITFVALGEDTVLTATVTASGGTAPTLTWFSTNPAIADVDNSGRAIALGNGEALIIARAGDARDTVTAIVRQVSDQLVFIQDPPLSAAGVPFLSPVVVSVLDRNDNRVALSGDSVSVELTPNPSGGTLGGTVSVLADAGFALFDDLDVDVAGTGYTLQATAAFGSVVSSPFNVLVAPDLVRFHNLAGYQLGALFDGAIPFFVNDYGLVQDDSNATVIFESSGFSDELIAFTRGRPPAVVSPAPWTANPDTIDVTFRDPIQIAVTAWIVRGPFDALRDRAIDQSITTTNVWDEERMGVEFSEFEIVDATNDPDAPALFHTIACNSLSQAESTIGKRAGRINIYYVETVDGGHDRGYSCGEVIFMADASGHELLVHEIGHSFGLGHVDDLENYGRTNVMHSASNLRRWLTEGQVFRSHFDTYTALNQIYGVVPNGIRACPDFVSTRACIWLGLRLWADGFFPPNY